jgi:hypothetical protein
MTNTSVALIQQLPHHDGHMDARNIERREINKYIKQNCEPSWTYLRDYTWMQGQQDIKLLQHVSADTRSHHGTCISQNMLE